ncbi:MAG TPA: toll/interleukin-1 receptor domain-containing protein, partial [Longimicrobium sp.]|nr:toll/interleukin-1 receptor domain-containing protein [Longimicrobium sp.]
MAKIFICYRRSDSAGHAGRLYDRLVARFGRNRVYMDLDSIPFGSDFVEEITKALNGCAAVLVLIGPQWFAGENRPRLTAAGDHVRQEIAQALKSKAKVFPVLFQGARMPAGTELPKDIQALSRLHAIDLRDVSFDTDVQQLFKALERLDGLKPAKPAGTGSTRSKKTKSRTQT